MLLRKGGSRPESDSCQWKIISPAHRKSQSKSFFFVRPFPLHQPSNLLACRLPCYLQVILACRQMASNWIIVNFMYGNYYPHNLIQTKSRVWTINSSSKQKDLGDWVAYEWVSPSPEPHIVGRITFYSLLISFNLNNHGVLSWSLNDGAGDSLVEAIKNLFVISIFPRRAGEIV